MDEMKVSEPVMYALLVAMFVGEGRSLENALEQAGVALKEPWFRPGGGTNLRPLAEKIVSLVRSSTMFAVAESIEEHVKELESLEHYERASECLVLADNLR